MKISIKKYWFVVKTALVIATVTVLFEVINVCVLYGYVKIDLYLSFVAVAFLTAGYLMNKKKSIVTAPKQPSNADVLTAKEKQVLGMIAQGKTNKEIAAANFTEISTVKTHVNNIYSKLSVKNRREAILRYTQLYQTA